MLISPPFLPDRQNHTEEQWLNAAMASAPEGVFPVSRHFVWHGGVHLLAPMGNANANSSLPVRAIADGTIVFLRRPTPRSELPDHPQRYPNGWTDNGTIVLRHQTDIGEGSQATDITFYSVYQHLGAIEPGINQGQRLARKTVLGTAGQIDGQTERRIHFEIVCDDENQRKLMGRSTGEVNVALNGRSDAVFGDIYVRIPAGTAVYAEQPPHNVTAPTAPAVHTTTEDYYVGIRYAGGLGTIGHRGDAYVTTYRRDGAAVDARTLEEPDAEYDMYGRATSISRAYPASGRPAPSAVYELLRFGRVIHSAYETLTPTDVPHWRKVRYPGGEGWVNLNAQGTTKFSDADFPQWRGWRVVDDDTNTDSRCESRLIRMELDSNGDGETSLAERGARLADAETRRRLSKTVCRFPSEWNPATFDVRWAWTTARANPNEEAIADESGFKDLRRYVNALSIDCPEFLAAEWHWEPKEFIRHFRRCMWLSTAEMVQCLPNGAGVPRFQAMTERLTRGHETAQQILPPGMAVALNTTRRKYLIHNDRRSAHFFGKVCLETDHLQTVREYASGNAYDMAVDPAKARELGNTQPGDGPRFKGRGVIQLTGKGLYQQYGTYRGMDFTTSGRHLLLQSDAYVSCDAAGFYWIAERTRDRIANTNPGGRRYRWVLDGHVGINRRADASRFITLANAAEVDADVLSVTLQVNRAALHIDERRTFFRAAYYQLSDDTIRAANIENLRPI
ncbi:hypothetical protein CR3_1505 [Cupriavidus gilardii CR3]|nr:hypothetical protein CR3_1505 [Cupriavidus gilardii CR3]